MKRKIIEINREKCTGCGLCINACHEGALKIVDGKAQLLSDSYCDGLGDCLPECPTGAISIVEKDVAAFDEERVKAFEHNSNNSKTHSKLPCGCPSTATKTIKRAPIPQHYKQPDLPESQLRQWPCQIKLVPTNAEYFQNAHLLIAADCTAYAYANFHNDMMEGKITLIGCSKLDNVDYSEKLAQIISTNQIKSITVVRMEVPCCGGIVNAVKDALVKSKKMIPWSVITISTDGIIIKD